MNRVAWVSAAVFVLQGSCVSFYAGLTIKVFSEDAPPVVLMLVLIGWLLIYVPLTGWGVSWILSTYRVSGRWLIRLSIVVACLVVAVCTLIAPVQAMLPS